MDTLAASRNNQTVLVVDDAEDIRKMICTMLLQLGYRVLEAADGSDALRTLETRSDSVHLVVTDLMMPQMGGTELAERLSRIRPELPVLFMSGYSDNPVVRGVESAGSLFLAKPFTTSTLAEKVRLALARSWPGASSGSNGHDAP
jgi:two-component system cell cycle sensor histidine kinase/response regulator CckA